MARLTEIEKAQLLRPLKHAADKPSAPPVRSLRSYIEFATEAARFGSNSKPVRFGGKHWKL